MDWFCYEKLLSEKGYLHICGIDEAGRGPLCGPVYAAAVILPLNAEIIGLNDSKKLSEKKRDKLFDIIKEIAVDYSIASASPEEIDKLNILNATFLAMKRACDGLKAVDYALIDGNRIKGFTVETECIVKGDSCCASIAAASILAKVSRDRELYELDKLYPQYGLAKHKGYPTSDHIDAVRKFGINEIYRNTFLKKIL